MISISKRTIWAGALIGLLIVIFAASAIAQEAASPEIDAKVQCDKSITLLNNRSKLLSLYQMQEERKFQKERAKWAERIAYAGQWTPKDAEKARKVLYKYDDMHKSYFSEINRQIEENKDLETKPLDCSDARKTEREERITKVRGQQSGQGLSGQALIEHKKKEISLFSNKEFKTSNEKMIKALRKAKNKNSVPQKDKLEVRSY